MITPEEFAEAVLLKKQGVINNKGFRLLLEHITEQKILKCIPIVIKDLEQQGKTITEEEARQIVMDLDFTSLTGKPFLYTYKKI